MENSSLGIDFKAQAFKLGSNYVNKAISSGADAGKVRKYFQVDNAYVIKKLFLILYPYRSDVWGSAGPGVEYAKDKFNESACLLSIAQPDLYIPCMAVVTYILFLAAEMGIKSAFHPEKLGMITTRLVMAGVVEGLVVKALGFFFDANELEILDIVAFIGYKYVIAVAWKVAALLLGSVLRNLATLALASSFVIFLAKSLKGFLLSGNEVMAVRKKRAYFLADCSYRRSHSGLFKVDLSRRSSNQQ